MASNMFEDEDDDDEENSFAMTIRFYGCCQIQDGKTKLDQKRQPLCKHYVEKAQNAIRKVLNNHLTPLPFIINPNGTALCQIASRDQLTIVLDNYQGKSELIDRECTDELNKLRAAEKLGLKVHEFSLHAHISDKDINAALSYFAASASTLSANGQEQRESAKDSSDSASLTSMASTNDLTKSGKKKKKKKKKKKSKKRDDVMMQNDGDVTLNQMTEQQANQSDVQMVEQKDRLERENATAKINTNPQFTDSQTRKHALETEKPQLHSYQNDRNGVKITQQQSPSDLETPSRTLQPMTQGNTNTVRNTVKQFEKLNNQPQGSHTLQNDFDPPLGIPDDLKGHIALLRVYVDPAYGEVKSVYVHLLSGYNQFSIKMRNCMSDQQIWYYPLENINSFQYKFTLKVKKRGWEKFTSFFMQSDGIVAEKWYRTFSSNITTDVFIAEGVPQSQLFDIKSRACAYYGLMIAKSIKNRDQLSFFRANIFQYTLISHRPKITLDAIFQGINCVREGGKLYLVSFIAMFMGYKQLNDIQSLEHFDEPTAKSLLDIVYAQHTFDVEVQQHIPYIYQSSYLKVNKRKPGKTDYILDCFPTLSGDILVQHLHHFNNDGDVAMIQRAVIHLDRFWNDGKDINAKKVLTAFLSSIPCYKILIDIGKSVKTSDFAEKSANALLVIIHEQLKIRIKWKLEKVKSNRITMIADLEEVMDNLKNYNREIYHSFLPECEDLIIAIIELSRNVNWEENQIECVIRIGNSHDLFTKPAPFMKLKTAALRTRNHALLFGIYKSYLETHTTSEGINETDIGRSILLSCLNEYHRDKVKPIMQAYTYLHQLESTSYAKGVPEFIDTLHQCLVEAVFKGKTCSGIAKISRHIPKSQYEEFNLLRKDVMNALRKQFDATGRENLNAWIEQFSEGNELVIETCHVSDMIIAAEQYLLELITASQQKDCDSLTLLCLLMKNFQFIKRTITCKGYYAVNVKEHGLTKQIKTFLLKLCGQILSYELDFSFLEKIDELITKWKHEFIALLQYFTEASYCTEVISVLEKMKQTTEKYVSQINEGITILPKFQSIIGTNLNCSECLRRFRRMVHILTNYEGCGNNVSFIQFENSHYIPEVKDIVRACLQLRELVGMTSFCLFLHEEWKSRSESTYFYHDIEKDELRILFGWEEHPQSTDLEDVQCAVEFAAYSCKQRFLRQVKNCFMTPSDVTLSEALQVLSDPLTENISIIEELTQMRITDYKRNAVVLFDNRETLLLTANVLTGLCGVFHVEQYIAIPVSPTNRSPGSTTEKQISLKESMIQIKMLETDPDVLLSRVLQVGSPLDEVRQEFEQHERAFDTLEQLSKSRAMTNFLQSIANADEETDLRNLIDAVEEYTEEYVQESTVSDLIQVNSFLRPIIYAKDKPRTIEDLLLLFWKCQSIGKSDMAEKIENCSANIHNLRSLYMNVSNRGEVTKETISNILNNGSISIHVEVGSSKLDVAYRTQTTTKNVQLSELNDLKSRALLIENTENEEGTSSLSRFVELVDFTNDLVEIAEDLCAKGHFDYQCFTVGLDDETSEEKLIQLEELTTELQGALSHWENTLDKMRNEHYFLNYIFSEQIPILYMYFKDGRNKSDAKQILEYISPNSVQSKHNWSKTLSKVHKAEEKLKALGEILDDVCDKKDNSLHFPDNEHFVDMNHNTEACVIPGKPFIAQVDKDSNQGIPILLSIYANTVKRYPEANQIIFCTRHTTLEEITMLFNRCMSSPTQLFCLFGVEQLDYAVQVHLVTCLNRTIKCISRKRYLLSVICRETSNYPLLQNFIPYVNRIQGMNSTSIRECFRDRMSRLVAVTSEVPSLGKTEFIFEEASKKQLYLHTIHVSGHVTKESLVRLIPLKPKYDAYHFDIGQVENPDTLDSFMFEFLILRCVVSGTSIAHLGDQDVFVEIANTLQHSLRNSLYLVSHFDRKHIKWDDYQSLKVSDELSSPIQVVCNYLESDQQGTIGTKDLVFVTKPNVKVLPAHRCRELLKLYFSNVTDMSYSILNTFLEVLAFQLKKLSSSQFFRIVHLKGQVGEDLVAGIRHKMLTIFIEMSKEFACRSIHTCRSTQSKALLMTDDAYTESLTQRMSGMIQWEESNHFLVLFNSISSHTITPLYRKRTDVDTNILRLIEGQLKVAIPDFHKFTHEKLQSMLEKLVCARYDKTTTSRVKKELPNYALTPDNLIKMVLIALRITARLPIVLMGETGCGKTSLVRYLALTYGINKFYIINFHAGVSQEEIIQKIEKYHKEAIAFKEPIWIFLDEINTCNHLGIINDIICHHRCSYLSLSTNMVFIAACNPYRLRSSEQIHTAGLVEKMKTDAFSRLVYRVFPLPESMLDYIWDYGVLNQRDEEVYISEMLKDVFSKYKVCTVTTKLVEMVVKSNQFIRDIENNHCSVSLRDVHRCRTLIDYFDQMLQDKSKYPLSSSAGGPTCTQKDDTRTRNAVILSLAHCYGVRIHTTEQRLEFYSMLGSILFNSPTYGKYIQENIVRAEQLDILNRMTIPDGIAKNTALRENVFVLFVSIMNKMPVFLVGKPGCSKSLSMQLLRSSLRGQDSTDKYFKSLPQLYVVSYQGSESSTSDGILNVFDKAEKYLKHNANENVLPVVLLDEIGLAEVSSHNPLKVLHNLLEPSNSEFPNVSVVGISNWALDAAKMNRAIHLSRPDLSIQELLDTAVSISQLDAISTTQQPNVPDAPQQEAILTALATAYFEYQSDQKQRHFHGLRDFYSLVKYVSREVANNGYSVDDEALTEIIFVGLQRNFGGGKELKFIIDTFFEKLSKQSPLNPTSVDKLIDDNIKDQRSRHLLVITRGDSVLDILAGMLQKNDKQFEVIFGSNFEEDQSEGYQYRILSKIIHCMEVGKVLILKDLEDIYGSLYDMLNQNYTIVGSRKNCRIALGAHSNPMCQVHDQFKCIVLIEEDKIDFSDPPFLNRFEKQKMLLSDLLTQEEKGATAKLEKWMERFNDVGENSITLKDTFMGIEREALASLVYTISRTSDDLEGRLVDSCQDHLLRHVTPDGIMRLPKSKLAHESENETRELRDRFLSMPYHKGISSFVSRHQYEKRGMCASKWFIFTHSNIHTDVANMLGDHGCPCNVRLNNIHNEQQLASKIGEFYSSDSHDILVVQCQPAKDGNLLKLKILIEQTEREWNAKKQVSDAKKQVFVILHVDRIDQDNDLHWSISYNAQWSMCTIDDLEESDVQLNEIVGRSIPEILQLPFCPISECIKENLLWAFSRFKYPRIVQQSSLLDLINNVIACEPLMRCIEGKIMQTIYEEHDDVSDSFHPDNWQVLIACDSTALLQGKTLFGAWKSFLNETIKRTLLKLVWFIEKNSAWNSMIANKDDKHIVAIWLDLFEMRAVCDTLDQCVLKENEWITINTRRLDLQFPFSKILFDAIRTNVQDINDILAADTNLEGVENLDSLDENDITEIISSYEPVVSRACQWFLSDSNLLHSEVIFNDIMCLFVQNYVQPTNYWIKACGYLHGETINDQGRTFMNRLTLMFVSFGMIAPQFELLTTFERTYGKQITEVVTEAVDQYENDRTDPFIDLFVRKVCQMYIPRASRAVNSDQLRQEIPIVLAYCARLSCFPEEIHLFKLYADLVRKSDTLGQTFIERLSEIEYAPAQIEPVGEMESTTTDESYTSFHSDMDLEIGVGTSAIEQRGIHEGNNIQQKEVEVEEHKEEQYQERQLQDELGDDTHIIKKGIAEGEMHKDEADTNKEIDEKGIIKENVTQLEYEDDDNEADEKDNLLDSVEVFHVFRETIEPLLDTNSEDYQQLWCLYFSRCFDANPDSPLFHTFLEGLAGLPISNMTYVTPVLVKFFKVHVKEYLIQCPTEEMDFENLNKVLDVFCRQDPPQHIKNILCDVCEMVIENQKYDHGSLPRSEEGHAVQQFQRASLIVHESTMTSKGLHYVICVAICKQFIRTLPSNPLELKAKYGHFRLNDIEQCMASRSYANPHGFSSPLQILLVKSMHEGTLSKLKNRLRDLDHVFSRLSEIKWPNNDPTEYGIGIDELTERSIIPDLYETIGDLTHIEKTCKPLLANCRNDPNKLIAIMTTIGKRLFWIRFIDAITDTERQWANCFGQQLDGFSDAEKELMACLAGNEDFKHKSMNISTQTKDSQFYQAQVIYTVLLSTIPFQKDEDKIYLVKLLFHWNNCLTDKILCQEPFIQTKLDKSVIIYGCDCNSKTLSYGSLQKCTACGTTYQVSGKICKKIHSQLHKVLTVKDMLDATIQLPTSVERVTSLILQAVTVASANLGTIDKENKTEEDVFDVLCQNWKSITNDLVLSDRDLCYWLKIIVRHLVNPINNINTMRDMHNEIQAKVRNLLQTRSAVRFELFSHVETSNSSLNRYLLEIDDVACDAKCKEIHRYAVLPNEQLLEKRMQEHAMLNSSRHSFLYLIQTWDAKLRLIPHIVPMLDFLKWINARVNHRMSREECYDKEMQVFIGNHEESKSIFNNFLSAWGVIRSQCSEFKEFFESDSLLASFDWTTKISNFVFEDQNHVIIRIAQILLNWQNGFLDIVSVYTLEGCKSLKFLAEKDRVRIPKVSQFDITNKHVVGYKWDSGLLLYGQVNAEMGCGNDIVFDFDAIEISLANQVLLGKCYIEPSDFRVPTYKNEMFLSSNEILDDVKLCINQEKIPEEFVNQLSDLDGIYPGLMKGLMEALEIILPLVIKTERSEFKGQIAKETIGSFADRWKMARSSVQNDHLNKLLNQSLRLTHLVHLYELSEDKASVVIMKSIGDEFRQRITEDEKDEITSLDKEGKITVIQFNLALRRFAMRFLWRKSSMHASMAPTKPLHDAMRSVSLWTSMSQDKEADMDQLLSLLPKTLTVAKTRTISEYLDDIAKPEKKYQLRPITIRPSGNKRRERRRNQRME